jgi:D-glycero-D-manno-heptose 1,7-bisphosphate phosphatase
MGIGPLKRAVFLDRDGVLNEAVVRDGKPYPPRSETELRIFDGAADHLRRLRQAGFKLIVVTNQPDVARGTQAAAEVEAIHGRLRRELPLDDVLSCLHDDADGCACRKPKPGLILDGAARHAVDVSASFMVGDRWRDVEAGQAAGCKTVWIDRGYRERGPAAAPHARVASLAEAADWILSQVKDETVGKR